MVTFYIALISIGLVTLHIFKARLAFPSTQSLLPFQRGVLFRRGHPVREVGPGRHRIFVGREKIVYLDSRPIDVKSGYRIVALADGSIAEFAFTASCEIRDVQKVMYSSAYFSSFPIFVALSTSRAVLNGCERAQIESAVPAVAGQVMEACRTRLTSAGFDLKSFTFIRLAIAAPRELPL